VVGTIARFWSDLTSSQAFASAALLAGAALILGVVVVAFTRRNSQPPVGGYLYALAALGAMAMRFDMPWAVPAGAALVAAACAIGDDVWDRTLGSVFGAALVVFGADVATGVGAIVLTTAIAACAALVVAFDRTYRDSAIGLPLLAAAAFGVLVTVPDTERAMALFGAGLPLILLGWPGRLVSLGPGAGAAVALFGWVGGIAAAARPGAAVGALGALGLMLAAPIGMRIVGVARPALARLAAGGPLRALLVVALHGVVVFGAARVAGLQQSAVLAAMIVAPFLAVVAVIGAAPAPSSAPTPAETGRQR
jgi:hypothetical protein